MLEKGRCMGKLIAVVLVFMSTSINIFAWQGDMGYESGISTGQQTGKTVIDYKEVVFISGEPIEFSGTLTMKKTLKKDSETGNDSITTSYNYALKNIPKEATLSRTVLYSTVLDKKDNGQTVEITSISGTPTETIKIGNNTFDLLSLKFTRTGLVDPKPAIEYFSGNFMWEKVFSINASAAGNTAEGSAPGTVKLNATGNFVGFNEYWGSTETVKYDLRIQSEDKKSGKVDRWEGNASVKASYSKKTDIRYEENEPTAISFDGGYIMETSSKSVLEYDCKIPEFDSDGISTYNMIDRKGMMLLETFPITERLKVSNLMKIRGHWAQSDIDVLQGLEVYNYDMDAFDPEEYMNRGEFADAIVKAAKEVPKDPVFKSKTQKSNTTSRKSNAAKVTVFSDVTSGHMYLDTIESAFNRGMISGRGHDTFSPDDYITFADAVTILIRTLGLEQVSKWPGNITSFKDNDEIPSYARDHIYAAIKIGLIKGDNNGYIRPDEKLSKARAAAIINRLIDFMRKNLVKEYTENIINY